MKYLITLALAGSLTLVGCAAKKPVEEAPLAEAPPAPIEQPAPVVAEEPPVSEPVASAPVKEAAVEQAAERIFFEFDSYTISEESRMALEGNARWLQERRELRIVIEGHADERGSDTYNLALGDKRARAAREYLMALGVAADRISVISYGEEMAAQGAANPEVWAKDRKAEFVVAN